MTWPTPDKLAQNAAPPVGAPSQMDLSGLVMEPKLDGFRLLVHRGPNGVEAFTRSGKSQKGKIPHLEAELSGLPEGTWLDGELVYFDAKGMPEWGQVQSCMGSNAGDPQGVLTYVAFDLLTYNGLDVRPLPLSERRHALMTVLGSDSNLDTAFPHVKLSGQRPATHSYHDALIEQGMEGTIVKDPTKPYASGKRGHGWTKFKANDEMDVVIMGYKAGENSFTGLIGAIEFGQYADCDHLEMKARCDECKATNGKVLRYRGRCSGMDMKKRQEISNDPNKFLGQVISLAYMGIMPSGSPRHPQYKRFRPDKLATDCEWT